MEQLLSLRQNLINFYKKFEVPINYSLKFVVALVVFTRINTLGLYREEFHMLFNGATGFVFNMLISLIFTVSPPVLSLIVLILAITLQLSLVMEVAILVFLFLSLLILFYARLAPRQSMLMLAIVIGFYLHVPYAVVLFAGLYMGAAAIIPLILGTAVWTFLPFFTDLAERAEPTLEFDLVEMPLAFLDVFAEVYEALTTNLSWVIIGFVFAMMVLSVHLISRLAIDYAKDIALAIGAAIGLICMLMVAAVLDIDISFLSIILGSIVSVGIIWIVKFFDMVLDYKKVEKVQFDDDDNVYYVKIVPKVKLPGQEVVSQEEE